ncbi:MAG: CmcI family methyltransferase [Bryobacteraceae bacterium]|jgi:cephalosporin hydroxylase
MNRSAILLCGLAALCCGCGHPPPAPTISEIPIGDQSLERRLLRGFYESTGAWRWTARVFAVSLDPPPPGKDTYLELDFDLPHEVMNAVRIITLTARVNGMEVGRQTYNTMGRRIFARRVPDTALHRRPTEVEFELNREIRDQNRGRNLGLIALNAGLMELEGTTAYHEAESRLARDGYAQIVQRRNLRLPAADEQELMKLFHQLPVWENLWFHNVRLIKNPLDLWMMQQVIYEVQPDFIIETGTWRGGSALYWANVLEGMGLEKSRVLTVDIQDSTQQASTDRFWKKYVDFYLGSSTDPEIVSAISNRVKGRKTIVTLDSDHSMQHVLRELRMYSPMISRGSYLVVEDTHLDGVPTHPEDGPGPLAATLEFLKEGGGQEFEPDFSREKMVMTFNPGGWLRRK